MPEPRRTRLTTDGMLDLDAPVAAALAVVTAVSGSSPDEALAARLLDELLAPHDGDVTTARSLVALCGALLAMQEYETGTAVDDLLARVGGLLAQASLPA